jgi:hypothetical protein
MAESNEEAGKFEFDPKQLGELGDLAEAFIHEEVDADLFDELDRDYLEWLVSSAESELPEDVTEEYEAAIEVAELILDRMDATDY